MSVTRTDGSDGRWLLLVLLMGMFVAQIDVAVVNVATPSIRERLAASDSELQLVVSGYTLVYAMLLITSARLGGMYGYRRVFLIGLAIFTVASLACGLAPNPVALILARLVQGSGAALLVPQVLTGIQLNFSGAVRTRAIGYYALVLSIGAVAGQVLGGVLISANLLDSGWRPIFLINLPIGAIVMIAAMRFLPAHQGSKPERMDLPGLATLSLAVLLVVLPLILGHTLHWPTWTWVCLAASVVATAAFIVNERRVAHRGDRPLVNLHLVTGRVVGWALVSYGAALATYFALLFTLALYLQEGLGRSALHSGLSLLSWVMAFGIGGLAVSRVPPRFSHLVAPCGFLVLFAAYCAISAHIRTPQPGDAVLLVALGLGGLGTGVGITATIRRVTAAVAPRHAADISGLIATTAQIAGVAGVSIFGTLYFSIARAGGAGNAMQAFAIVVAAFAATAMLAALAAFRSGTARSSR